jgi:hypothetical protein
MDLAEIARAHPGWFRLWVVASLVWVAAAIIAQWDDVFPASPVRTSGTPGITYPDMEFHRACDARFGVLKPTQAQLVECVSELKSTAERKQAWRRLKPFLIILLPPILVPLAAVGAVQTSRWVKRGFDEAKSR